MGNEYDFGLTFNGSLSASSKDSGSGFKTSDTYSNKVTLINENTEKSDINKYFFSIIIFIISLFILTLLLTLSEINFEQSFKLSILTIMNTFYL